MQTEIKKTSVPLIDLMRPCFYLALQLFPVRHVPSAKYPDSHVAGGRIAFHNSFGGDWIVASKTAMGMTNIYSKRIPDASPNTCSASTAPVPNSSSSSCSSFSQHSSQTWQFLLAQCWLWPLLIPLTSPTHITIIYFIAIGWHLSQELELRNVQLFKPKGLYKLNILTNWGSKRKTASEYN